ncbi:hypothetical protein TNCV_3364991 [Trichonephila clavipes]|nr:hypothetical protein TNCV_3364991 [Trichonephila clavipes]
MEVTLIESRFRTVEEAEASLSLEKKFKFGSKPVDLQMIESRVWLSPQPLSLASPQINHCCGCPIDSVTPP